MNEQLANQEKIAENEVSQIDAIVDDLKKQGLEIEQIIEALQKMVAEGKITEEDFAQATQKLEAEEKNEASKMFGINLL